MSKINLEVGKVYMLDADKGNRSLVKVVANYGTHFCRVKSADNTGDEWDVMQYRLSHAPEKVVLVIVDDETGADHVHSIIDIPDFDKCVEIGLKEFERLKEEHDYVRVESMEVINIDEDGNYVGDNNDTIKSYFAEDEA